MGWVDLPVGLGWVVLGRDFSVFSGWVMGSTVPKVQYFSWVLNRRAETAVNLVFN